MHVYGIRVFRVPDPGPQRGRVFVCFVCVVCVFVWVGGSSLARLLASTTEGDARLP